MLRPHHANLSTCVVNRNDVPVGINHEAKLADRAHTEHGVPVLAPPLQRDGVPCNGVIPQRCFRG